MSHLIIFGATGSLGSNVLRQALAAGHDVTAFVRNPSKLPVDIRQEVSVQEGDLSKVALADLARLIEGHDALIYCAGHVSDGQTFVSLVDRLATAIETLPSAKRPVCWFLAGVALLDIDPSGRRGVAMPMVRSTYWPHQANFERLTHSEINWRLLCPGPMTDDSPRGISKLRISLDILPLQVSPFVHRLPDPMILPAFRSLIPQLIVPYADAAALMLANLDHRDPMARRRVGLAPLPGTTQKKSDSSTKP